MGKTNVLLHATYCQQVRTDYPGHVFKPVITDGIMVASAADQRNPGTQRA